MNAPNQRNSLFRTLLLLGRVSNLPTVWSNCLAGWLLTGEPLRPSFALVLSGAACLYTGGMFLNDVCDADFDRQHREERPIPSGLISRRLAWTLALLLLMTGVGLFAATGNGGVLWALLLLLAIVTYDWLHKRWAPSLVLMPVCRSLLYLAAAAAALGNVQTVMFPAMGLGVYVLGISLIARSETESGRPARWPLLLVVVPLVVAAYLTPAGGLSLPTLFCFALLCSLMASALFAWKRGGETPRWVGRLIAAIVLVDWLFVTTVPAPVWSSLAFAVLLASALLLQRRVPAS